MFSKLQKFNTSHEANRIKICLFCLKKKSTITKTKKSSNIQTLKDYVNSTLSLKEKEQLASGLIKNIAMDKGESSKQSKEVLSLSQLRGKTLKILLDSNEKNSNLKRKQISVEVVSKISASFNLSTNVVKGIASSLRTATQDRKLFESNLSVNLHKLNHSLDVFFSFDQFHVTKSTNYIYHYKPLYTVMM